MTNYYAHWISQMAIRDAAIGMLLLYAISMYLSWQLANVIPYPPQWRMRDVMCAMYVGLFLLAVAGPQVLGVIP